MTSSSRTLQHVGEWKVELRGDSLEDVFTELARLLAQAAGPEDGGAPGSWASVALEARDHAALLADWANELIGRSEIGSQALGEVRDLQVRSAPAGVRLTAQVRGRPVGEAVSPVKATTYHEALVEPSGTGWRGVILLDV